MQRFLDQAGLAAQFSGRRFVILTLATVTLGAALALPSQASANQTLTIQKKGTGTGTVTSSPAGISCGATCSFAFADNTLVTLTGAPGANSGAVAWSGCDSLTLENKCKVTMSSAKTVTATFNLVKRKLTVSKAGTGTGTVTSSPAGINCGSECSAEYDHDTEVTLSGTSGANTEAVKWSGCTSVSGENKCLVSMTAAKSVTATFNLGKRELKVAKKGSGTGTVTSSPTGINCGSTCSFVFNEGTMVTLTGTPSGEAEAAKWLGCDSVNAEDKCLVTINAVREVTAIFNLPSYTLTIAKLGNGTGTVTSSPAGIECGVICAEGFVKGSTVTLTGSAGLHSEKVKWTGCDNVNAEGKCLVAMSQAKTVFATFVLEPQYVEYTIAVQRTGTGTGTVQSAPGGIECGPNCSGTYVYHTQLTLTATPTPGSEFVQWVGGTCSGQTGPCISTVNADRYLKAVFVAVGTRALTVSKAGTGHGSVRSDLPGIECGSSCSAEFDAASKVVLRATPEAGSTFAGWSGAGCSGTKACRVTMSEVRNVTATFEKPAPPPSTHCVVPALKGKTLARARNALQAAHCALGRVRKPKGAKLAGLRVRSTSPGAGSVLEAGGKVGLRLGRPRRK